MWKLPLGRGVLFLMSAEYSVVMCEAYPGTLVTSPWLLRYDILLSSQTLVSDMRNLSKILVSGFCRPVLLCRGRMPGPEGWLHANEMDTEHFGNQNLSVVVAK